MKTKNRLEGVFADLPEEIKQLSAELSLLREDFHSQMSGVFETALEKYLRLSPPESLADRQRFALWLGDVTQKLGLTVASPRTGKPSMLMVRLNDHVDPPRAEYAFCVRDERGNGVRESATHKLVSLHVMPIPSDVDMEAFLQHYRRNNIPGPKR